MTELRIVDDPVARLHSVRADSSRFAFPGMDAVEAVIAVLPSGESRPSFREDAAVELVEAIHEHLRDGSHVVELRVEGLTRAEWDAKDGRHINGWSKRQEFRAHGGGLVASITWETDEGWEGG